jgi:hypothetical protein
MKITIYKLSFLAALLSISIITNAHNTIVELENLSKADTALLYLQQGFKHIIPLGIDHILFVLSLFLLSPKLKPILYQATAFTVAHSITLALSMFNVISPAAAIVEPIISISIAYVAIENIVSPSIKKSRLAIVFLFGLIHGMGFAGALGQLGMPEKDYATALVMFNIGVELAQLAIIVGAWFLVGKWFAHKTWYNSRIVMPVSIIIALIATYWTVARILG